MNAATLTRLKKLAARHKPGTLLAVYYERRIEAAESVAQAPAPACHGFAAAVKSLVDAADPHALKGADLSLWLDLCSPLQRTVFQNAKHTAK